MTLSLRSRLTLVYTAVFSVLLGVIAVLSYRVLAYQIDADVTQNLTELTRGLHGYLHAETGQPTLAFDSSDPAEAAFVDEATRYYQMFDASSGDLIVQSDALRPLGLEFTATEVRQFAERPLPVDFQTDAGRLRFSNSVFVSPGGRRYLLQIGVSLAPMDRVLDRFLVLLAVAVPGGLLASFFVGRWTARVAVMPLTDLAAATGHIDVADLRTRLPTRGAGDELDDLAEAFNVTLSRLEDAVGEMRQFSAALAHELRTPLAALRGDIEMAMLRPGANEDLRRRLASQLEEIDKLRRLIDQILTLARAEAGEIPLTAAPVDLGGLAEALVEQLEPVAQIKNIDLHCRIEAGVIVRGDADWLKRLLLNLLDNAIKFTPVDGRVGVHVSRTNDTAQLSVEDTGVGIDPVMKLRIFERFFRADQSRSSNVAGFGLGLSLAKWIVDRHHGRIAVESQPEKGSTFRIEFPLGRA